MSITCFDIWLWNLESLRKETSRFRKQIPLKNSVKKQTKNKYQTSYEEVYFGHNWYGMKRTPTIYLYEATRRQKKNKSTNKDSMENSQQRILNT